MTKKQLLDLIAEYPDDAEVVIEVHDTTLHEDLYDFTLDPISWTRFNTDDTSENMHELRLCPIKNESINNTSDMNEEFNFMNNGKPFNKKH